MPVPLAIRLQKRVQKDRFLTVNAVNSHEQETKKGKISSGQDVLIIFDTEIGLADASSMQPKNIKWTAGN